MNDKKCTCCETDLKSYTTQQCSKCGNFFCEDCFSPDYDYCLECYYELYGKPWEYEGVHAKIETNF